MSTRSSIEPKSIIICGLESAIIHLRIFIRSRKDLTENETHRLTYILESLKDVLRHHSGEEFDPDLYIADDGDITKEKPNEEKSKKPLKFKDVAKREGKKVGVNIAQISEILNVVTTLMAEDVMVVAFLIDEMQAKMMKK